MRRFLCAVALLGFFASLLAAQSIPPIKAKALDDSEVTLPNPQKPQVLVLVVGFSKKSGDNCKPWGRKLQEEYKGESRVATYTLPVLQGAPSFIRPMILRGMRKDASAETQARMVPLYTGEEEWKKLVMFSAPDDPYLVVTAPDGHVVWQSHGAYSDALLAELKKNVGTAMEKIGK